MKRLLEFSALFIVALTVSTSFSYFPKDSAFGRFGSLEDLFFTEEEQVSEPKKSEIYFFGDIMMARKVERLTAKNGVNYPFENFSVGTSSAYLVGNFEAVIPEVHKPTQDFHFAFSVPSTSVEGLANFGFTHLGLANNHSYDFGVSNYLHTREVLRESELEVFGDQMESSTTSISYLNLNDEKVALIGLYAVNRKLDFDVIEELFAAVASSSERQIVFIHWGEEYELTHSLLQESIAKKLVELGADLIVGHHPHVVQDIVVIDNVPVFYSLGNYIFDQYFSEDVQKGLVLKLSQLGTTTEIGLIPVSTIGNQSSPYKMDIGNKADFLNDLASRSSSELQEMIKEGVITLGQ